MATGSPLRGLARLVCVPLLLLGSAVGAGLGPLVSLRAAEPGETQAASDAPQFDDQALEFFEKEVRPLLVKRCYECHSAGQEEPKGGLRVDSRAALLAGGDTGPAIVPGKPDESLLIDAINYGDIYQMPPKSRMPAGEVATLTRWVKLGAPWPAEKVTPPLADKNGFDLAARKAAHWAWQPIADPTPPAVHQVDWPRQDLDRFILARLEQAGLSPAPPTDKASLLRRVYFDLIGLPPTPEELQEFLADQSPQAYERVVDQLLKSPQFGIRWARHWLDLVRYAETYGHEFDYAIPHATEYRDYVVRAFQADVPYDQFLVEHLAGDLLESPRRHPEAGFNESVIGTGFWFLGEATHAPVDVRGDEAGRIDNQIDVMTKTFLGMAFACARCHDHKFDAISTADYYALAGFLQSSRRQEALLDPGGQIRQGSQRIKELRDQGDRVLREALPAAGPASAEYVARALRAVQALRQAEESAAALAEIAAKFQLSEDQLRAWQQALAQPAVGQGDHPLHPWVQLALNAEAYDPRAYAAFRERLLADAERAGKLDEQFPLLGDFRQESFDGWFVTGEAFGDGPTAAASWDTNSESPRALPPHLAHSGGSSPRLQGVLRSPTFTITHPQIFYRLNAKDVQLRIIIDGYFMDVYNGLLFRGISGNVDTKGEMVWHAQGGDLGRYIGHTAHLEIIDHGDGLAAVDQIRFSSGPAPTLEQNPAARRVFQQPDCATVDALASAYGTAWSETLDRWQQGRADQADTQWINWMLEHHLLDQSAAAADWRAKLKELGEAVRGEASRLPAPRRVLAMTDGTPEDTAIHIRGNHKTLGDLVPRRLPTALGGEDRPIAQDSSGRLELARKLVDPDNPLTSRVMVNRVWHHLFGRGIVASVDNFGVLGQSPTHPELLDHLARQFVRDGWSVKQLIRSLVLSSTYRMASHPEPEAERKDPENLLLHRARIRRLQGEAIRDAILAVSGRINSEPAGGSVPVHITAFMQGRGRPGRNGPLDGDGRRSIYTEVRRNFLPPMMLAFDTPIPFSTMGRRNVSNVPAQALILMNDPFVVQQAEVWAKRTLQRQGLDRRQRIQRMYQEALTRDASQQELDAAEQFLATQAAEYGLNAEQAAADPRVWTDLGHVLFNVKEFIYLR